MKKGEGSKAFYDESSVGTNGFPVNTRNSAFKAWMPFLRAVETYPRIRQKFSSAAKLRKVPDIIPACLVHGLATAPFMRVVPRQEPGRCGMQPVQAADRAHAGFIKARHGGCGDRFANDGLDRLKASRAVGVEICQGAFAEALTSEQFAHVSTPWRTTWSGVSTLRKVCPGCPG